ncbi:MAG: ferric-dicitrate binding protein FerR (iron transport regulator) [Paraglaciecola sp.]|jgi:ferric-dicitrate binding protein FerR (iron transport regulator)
MSLDEWLGFGVPEDILERATQWIALLDSDTADDKQRAEFFIWLEEDPLHAIAFEELSELWAKTSVIKNFHDLLDESKVLPFPHSMESKEIQQLVVPAHESWLPTLTIGIIVLGFISPLFF